MLTQSRTVKTLAASAALVATLGLGAVLGSPGVAQAQEETTTTPDSESSDRPARGDENCDHADAETDTSATT
jgi:hypothetical protein